MTDLGTTKAVRFDYLDLLRAALMVFGIPFHAALPFTAQAWAVNSPDYTPVLAAIAAFIHEWRLPTFFFIAGFFATLILSRRSPRIWMRGRLLRLGVPFLSAVVVIIPLQVLLISSLSSADWPTTWATFVARLTTPFDFPIGHVWFLLVLLIYCVLLVGVIAVWPGLRAAVRPVAEWLAQSTWRWLAIAICLAVPTGLAASAWRLWDVGRFSGGLVDEQFVLYLPAFVLGVVMGWNTEAMARLMRGRLTALLVTGAITTAVLVVIELTHADSTAAAVAQRVVGVAGGLIFCILLMSLVSRIPGGGARPVRWFVDASLVIYLVHHPLVILISAGLIAWDATPPLVTWALTCVAVLVVSGLIYEAINSVRLSRFLFTGRSEPGASLLRAPVRAQRT